MPDISAAVFQILLALLREPATPSDVLAELERREETSPPPVATFYRQVRRAQEAGWIEVVADVDAAEGPGRPGRVYRVTEAGRRAARAEARRLRRLADLALASGAVEGDAR